MKVTLLFACAATLLLNACTPPCPEPTGITVTEVTSTEAAVGWTEDPEATSWKINYGPTGFTPGSETIITTTDNPYTISGLIPATTYDVYVRADCSDDLSTWGGPVTFTTNCIAPAITSVTADTICGPGDAVLSATAVTGASIIWLDDPDATTPVYSGPTYPISAVTATTTYYAVAVFGPVCLSEPEPVTVVVNPIPPAISLGNDTIFCEGLGVTLGIPVISGYEYLWNTGATTSSILVTESGTYSLTAIDANKCTTSDDVNVEVLPLPKVEGFNFVPFFATGTLTVAFEPLEPLAVESYYWDFGDGNFSTEAAPVHVFEENSAYNIILAVTNDCGSDTFSLEINVDMNTGVTQVNQSMANLIIYPNPSNSKIIIDNKDGLKLGNIIVYSITGQTMYTGNAQGLPAYELPVGNLSSGMYSVSIQTNKGVVIRKIQVLR